MDVLGGDGKSVDGLQHRGEKGRGEIGGLDLTSQLKRTYTSTLLVIVDGVKGRRHTPPGSPGWAEFTIMMECTSESGHCQSICTLSPVGYRG